MREDLTAIQILIDASGSMASIKGAVIEGFNQFIQEQRRTPGKVILSIHQFSSNYYSSASISPICHLRDLHEVSPLTTYNYVPNGGTPLLYALSTTIDKLGRDLAAMPEHARPARVVFLTITDGEENTSDRVLFPKSKILGQIRHQQDKYNWKFVYLGANQDSFAEAGGIGISTHSTMNFAATHDGLLRAVGSTSGAISSYRTGVTKGVVLPTDTTTATPPLGSGTTSGSDNTGS